MQLRSLGTEVLPYRIGALTKYRQQYILISTDKIKILVLVWPSRCAAVCTLGFFKNWVWTTIVQAHDSMWFVVKFKPRYLDIASNAKFFWVEYVNISGSSLYMNTWRYFVTSPSYNMNFTTSDYMNIYVVLKLN